MKMRSALGAVGVLAAALALVGQSGVAAAQPRLHAASPARAASVSTTATLRSAQRISLASIHLVTGLVRGLNGQGLGGVCVFAAGEGGVVRVARTSASGRYLMSLPRAGRFAVSYRECQPGKAAVPAFAAPSARLIRVGAAQLTPLPPATVMLASQPASGRTVRAAGVVVPREGRIVRLRSSSASLAPEAGGSQPLDVGGIAGRVTNPVGKPLAGVCVSLLDGHAAEGISTSRNGTYKLGKDDFSPGRYLVLFTSNCGDATDPFVPIAPGRWAAEWYKDKFAQAKANKVRLRAHRVARGIDAVMQRGGEVSGTISGSDHRRLKHACAVLTNASGEEFGQAASNAKGKYTITGLDPGRYRLTGLGSCSGQSDYMQTWYPHAASIRTAGVIRVRLGHRVSGINMTLQKLGTITGFVRAGGKTGKPLRNICVYVSRLRKPSDFSYAITRKNGSYAVQGLRAGRYQVQAEQGCVNEGSYFPATYPHPVHVADGKTTSGIDLYMHHGGKLTGTVTDAATGEPIAGICVSDGEGDSAVSGKNGTYTISQLPAERTTVSFTGGCGNRGSYAPQYYDNQVASEAARQVRVAPGHVTAGINAAMRPGAIIAGRVTNTAGRPLSGVCVAILSPGAAQYGYFGASTRTNGSGAYREANLTPGPYAVAFFGCQQHSNAVATQWFREQSAEATGGLVDAAAGADLSGIDAVVSPGGAIAGTVVSATGRPIQSDCVTVISRRTGMPSGFQSHSGAGTYTISSLAPGRYTVVAADCFGGNLAQAIYRHPVTVRAGMTTRNVALKLPPGGAVAGRITNASNGKPTRYVCVQATPVSVAVASLEIGGGSYTSRTGAYEITGLRPGSYHIQIVPDCILPLKWHPATLPHAVRVTAGKVTKGVSATLHLGGSIAGRVSGPGVTAVPGACIEAYRIPGGLVGLTIAGAHGRYVVTGLLPGRYKVEFGDPSCTASADSPADLGYQWYDGAAGSGSATVITVRVGRTTSAIDSTLPADGSITGSVTGTGTAASPLSGVCVSAVPIARGEQPDFTVSAAGVYTLADLQPGRYRVEFQAGCGKTGLRAQWWQDARSSAAAKIITVRPGDTVSGIDARMTSTSAS